MALRVLVVGATGNFGARIVRALKGDPAIELVAASRRGGAVPGAEEIRAVAFDALASDFQSRLREIGPNLVIHCIGPFQGQDYRVVEAALSAKAHYLDLADGRAFVAEFAPAMDALARAAGRVAISGASTLPALPTAVIDVLREPMQAIDTVEIAIAPGQHAMRGAATLAAVFSYLGRPVLVWRNGRWIREFGWMDIRRVPLDIGSRWGALCEVPDLTLIPARYPEVQNVTFHAALEFRLQHLVLWKLAALRRMGLPFPVGHWAVWLDRVAGLLDPFAGDWGGMRVSVVGKDAKGLRVRRTWQLTVPAADGPEIPCMPAILLARRIASGERMEAGAHACLGFVKLAEFAPEFSRWGIRTRIEESTA
jgi:NAD(P)-dependent dehydrogenase (short-subunit alcohol dehydrogenase family)